MSKDDSPSASSQSDAANSPNPFPGYRLPQNLFAIPPPLKRVFDAVPLITYPANDLPLRAPRHRGKHVLHVFTTEEDAKHGRPSFNPGCLKWQTLLKFSKIPFRITPSSNHASPTGVLPFLQPAEKVTDKELKEASDPVSGGKIKKWLASQVGRASGIADLPDDARCETYLALLDNSIRIAWLYQLYLLPSNSGLVSQLYVQPCSSHPLVQYAITQQLVAAASNELIKATGHQRVSAHDVLRNAEAAFQALSTVLGEEEWFFGNERPGIFDASVFAYTHLILDAPLVWGKNLLADMLLGKHVNLALHSRRITEEFYLR